MRLFRGAALPLTLALAISARAADDRQAPVTLPGGVADTDGKIGYLTNPKGGIVAVDLEKGDVLWGSKDVTRPLIATGKRLIGLAPDKAKGKLRVIALDTTAKGKRVLESEAIALPDWVTAADGLDRSERGQSFIAQAAEEKGHLLLRWVAAARYYGGAAPSPEILKEATKDASGIARVSLDTGKVETRADEKKEFPVVGWVADLEKLPKEVRDIARRDGWQRASIVGPRAYGDIQKSKGKPMPFGTQLLSIQAVELKTGKVLWELTYAQKEVLPPPP